MAGPSRFAPLRCAPFYYGRNGPVRSAVLCNGKPGYGRYAKKINYQLIMTRKKKQTVQYSYKIEGLYKVPVEDGIKELDRIAQKNGRLDPEAVVEESRDVNSVLHTIFDWNDTTAAAKYRVHQAQKYIGSICVKVIDSNVDVGGIRVYHCVREDKDALRNYVTMTKIVNNDVAYDDLLHQAKADMNSFIMKYTYLDELKNVRVEMAKAINGIK